MQIEMLSRPAGTVAKVTLGKGEVLTAEKGAMLAMSQNLVVETTSQKKGGKGGLMSMLKSMLRWFSGESFFINHFTSNGEGEEIYVGPPLIGDVVHHKNTGGTLIIQGTSWMASSADIEVSTMMQKLTAGFFGGDGLFWVKCTGNGDILLNSFGAIYEVDVKDTYTVDTGHIVAYEDTLQFKVGQASKSLIGSILGGEGLVAKFSGSGKLYCQTHNPPSFGGALGPNLKPVQR